ncbi:hypothetical protein RRG08_058005 [Elysia crispata]|uniref:Uncharacterized protein n=1 Tax=Elysia crispata TaxID=231223 RepID=A0AAE0Z2Z4_9GAST|nr:hypothetical protein RRG08_058005 [Elysia crispata]
MDSQAPLLEKKRQNNEILFEFIIQEESIGFTVLGNSKLDWLTDQNDTTCNNDKETPVYLALKPPIPLGWSRIVVNSPVSAEGCDPGYTGETCDRSKCVATVRMKLLEIICAYGFIRYE